MSFSYAKCGRGTASGGFQHPRVCREHWAPDRRFESGFVNGAGLLVGSASNSGFLSALRKSGGWDLDRRMVARLLPQPLKGNEPNEQEWNALRSEFARQAEVLIFVGGTKHQDGAIPTAPGIMLEFECAKASGAFLLPIGATGRAAKDICQLMGSPLAATGTAAQLIALSYLSLLSDQKSRNSLVTILFDIIDRVAKVS